MSKRRQTNLIVLVVLFVSLTSAAALFAQDKTPPDADPWYPPPEAIDGQLTDAALRAELLAHKLDLCQDLEAASSVILNTGVLNGFRPLIQDVAGMTIPELEAALQTCTPEGFEAAARDKTNAELVADVRMVEWLLKIHLGALDQATMTNPRLRPVESEGAYGDFLRLHDVLIIEMRADLANLLDGDPTLEDGQIMGAFWQDVLVPHAQAENSALFPLLRTTGNEQLAQSANVIEGEHAPIEAGIARYLDTLQAVEQGNADVEQLIPLAREVRSAVELHFGREEATLIGPLEEIAPGDQFAPAVAEQDNAIGSWLREHGWVVE